MGLKQFSKVEVRLQTTRKNSRELLEQIVSGQIDVYVGYRRLYVQWCFNNATVAELRPMFRIPNVSPDGPLSVTEEFKAQVISIARDVLADFRD